MPVARIAFILIAMSAVAGCAGIQSALAPGGPNAEQIATLSAAMFIGGGLIFLVVMALALYVVFAAPEGRRRFGNNALIIGAGLVFPILTLTVLLLYGFSITGRTGEASASNPNSPPLRIEVIGEQWWWRVRYIGGDERADVVTANEIHVPTGRPVELTLKTADVIHSFWVPSLAGKLDMIPGKTNTLRLQADEPGVYRGQCAEYCGGAHALMAFYVVAQPRDTFAEWLAAQERPAPTPRTAFLQRGQELFLASGCGACHTIRGTRANGKIGPDLTHVGSRRSLAAGILPNNVGTLAGWIADSQRIKPENGMPSFRIFEGESLRAIAAYLESLK